MVGFRNVFYKQDSGSTLTKDSHAYQMVKCQEHGSEGFKVATSGPSNGHGKNFGTMIHAVNKRAFDVLGVKGDPRPYPRHNHKHGEGLPRSQLVISNVHTSP